jgi:glycosyltransferase involved in cell wall biosynthesis
MKILYYSPHPQLSAEAPTGYGTHMREMVAAFRKNGAEVKTLIAGDLYERAGPSDLKVRKRRRKLRKLRSLIPKLLWESLKDLNLMRWDRKMEQVLKRNIAEFQPDVIYERVAYMQNSGVRIAKAAGLKHIAEINAPYPEERRYFSGPSLLMGAAQTNLRQVLIQSDLIVTVSSALASHFAEVAGEAAAKTLVLPNAVNPREVVHTSERLAELRTQLGLDNALIFGFVGSIFPYHGVDLLIEAFAGLPKAPRSKLLLVGDGESLTDLRALVRKLNLTGDVVFTESVPHREVYLYIELMDICCMAKSNWYGSPVKLFEYGLLKKAVIAPNVQPVRDVMNDGNAVLVASEVEPVRDAMHRLMADESLRKRLAEAWHLQVLKEHTWENAAKKIIERCA